MVKKYFGIDLGTTYSCIACCNDNDKTAYPILNGSVWSVPSVVYFDTNGTPKVGTYAKSRLKIMDNAERTIKEAKLEMGQQYCNDKIVIGPINSNVTRQVSPIEVSSCILNYMMKMGIDDALTNGEEVDREAVITVPAGFSFEQRTYTKKAAQLAGIHVLGLLQEPTAAALAHNIADGETVLVFDLGGGTLDVSIVRHISNKYEVLGIASDTKVLGVGNNIGGKNWDDILARVACQKHKVDFQNADRKDKAYLLCEAEDRKKDLSEPNITSIDFKFSDNTIENISRTQFERNCHKLLNDCIKVVESAIEDAQYKLGNEPLILGRFLLVGGSSKMPMIRQALDQAFTDKYSNGKESSRWMLVTNRPETSIAEGAAIYARLLRNGVDIKDILYINDRSQCSYGTSKFENNHRRIRNIIKKNENMVVTEKRFKFRTHDDNQRFIPVDIFENNSIEDTIDIDDSTKQIFDEIYEIDHNVPKKTRIDFIVSRDQDGLITIKVQLNGCAPKVFNADTSVPLEHIIEEQIKKSINLMQQSLKSF